MPRPSRRNGRRSTKSSLLPTRPIGDPAFRWLRPAGGPHLARTINIIEEKPFGRLRIESVVKRFGDFTAVDGISIDIASGEFVTLVGASGCGKTTLLRLIAGFARPDSGEIWIGERRVDDLPLRKRNIGFVFQTYALFPTMTVPATSVSR